MQGFEKQVLAGARETLRKVEGVQLEINLEPLYSGSWAASEAISFMEEEGFVIAQTETVNHRRHDPVSALEMDCLFRRREAADGVSNYKDPVRKAVETMPGSADRRPGRFK